MSDTRFDEIPVLLSKSIQNESLKTALLAIYEESKKKFEVYPATLNWHHSYAGGLLAHTQQTIVLARDIRAAVEPVLHVGTEEDVVLVAFVSCLDSLLKFVDFGEKEAPKIGDGFDWEISGRLYAVQYLTSKGVILEPKHLHALTFVTAQAFRDDEDSAKGAMAQLSPLAFVVRMAKSMSAAYLATPESARTEL